MTLVVFLCGLNGQNACALGIDLNKIPKVMAYDKPSDSDFAKTSKKIENPAPYDDELLGYMFYLPEGWTDNLLTDSNKTADDRNIKNIKPEDQKTISDVLFSMLGKYIGSPKNLHRSFVTIEGQKLAYEVKALHWFVSQTLTNGLSLAAVTEVSIKRLMVFMCR